ncbi:MAG TPA: N-acetylmuramoyl-L-alanine amidase [Thermopetrobacter sp.]|nr:N-acetylmuramoyl-L-alanine amidase [Thermopetrobacter sp.]
MIDPAEWQGSGLVSRHVVSPNFGARRGGRGIDMIVLHYTGCPSAESALLWMCTGESQVSAHYLVDEDGEIVQLVDERARAWHAGAACWAGESDVNSRSIGIEIQNPGHAEPEPPPYGEAQMAAVIALCRDIMARHGIDPARVVGHSDVAPMRKCDPGEHFPWRRLAAAGVALAPAPAPEGMAGEALRPGDAGAAVAALQAALAAAGYHVPQGGHYCPQTEAVVRAFQRRFRPARVDGVADPSTRETLARLLAEIGAAV